MMTKFHAQLAEHITPFNDAMKMPDVVGIDFDERRFADSARWRR